MESKMADKVEITVLSDEELDQVAGGAQPDQGSGKNPAGNVVDPFAGNPHERPGANALDNGYNA